MNAYLQHFGTKGQKWGKRNWQYDDGSYTPAGKIRYGIGDGKSYRKLNPKTDEVIQSGSVITRWTPDKNEKKTDIEGKYASITKSDRNQYLQEALENKLGYKSHKEIWGRVITSKDDAVVRKGTATVEDIVGRIGDKSVTKAYKELSKAGYYDDRKSQEDRIKIAAKSDKMWQNRNTVAHSLNKYMYTNMSDVLKEYKSKGYDAIVDPEDFTYAFDKPLILLNEDKFTEIGRAAISSDDEKEIRSHAKK